MADINFYIRKFEYGGDSTHRNYVNKVSGQYVIDDLFDNCIEDNLYFLSPTFSYNGEQRGSIPSSITTGDGNFVFIYDRHAYTTIDWCDYGSTNSGKLTIYGDSTHSNDYQLSTNSNWATNWTIGTYDTFKNEVTSYLAGLIGYERSGFGQGSLSPDQNSWLSDWNVYIFYNVTSAANETLVIFYPGNDSNYDEIIVETI